MTAKTRYFVVASLVVLAVGLGTGLVAYFVGLPAGLQSSRGGPEELKYVPKAATIVAYANVHDVMNSDLRRHLRAALPARENGQRELEDETGINLEKDIDRIVAFVAPEGPAVGDVSGSGLVLARGHFDQGRIEALLRQHGAEVEEYKGRQLLISRREGRRGGVFGVAFLEPGLTALGSANLLRTAVDLAASNDSVTSNEELMDRVRSIEAGHNAWAVGRFDALRAQVRLPGSLLAEARDADAATNLRDVLRGFLALAKMQTASRPELQLAVQSLEIGGENTTVSLSFSVPAQVFDLLGTARGSRSSGVQ
jgi:hypothetical protein